MATVQQWGRKESIIWPPRGYVYTLGAFIFACILTGIFVWIRFQYGLLPLQRYYLPYYLRTETAGLTHPVSQYQLLYVSDGEKARKAALDSDVQPGSTPQFGGKALPLMLTPEAAKHGAFYLTRESFRNYQNKALHAWIGHWIYQDVPIYRLFTMQLVFGLVAFAVQLPFSIRKDIRRIKDLRYGRRLKGPVLVNGRQFTKAVAGNGIGITTNDSKLPLRIPRDAENKHFLIVGDTGSGKSSVIRQMLYQVESRGDSAIVYDPACEFVKQFYNPHRGDIVLNPLDARMPYWNPSKELRRKAEAKALAVSLYQPEGVSNRFFVEAPQKIFAHLLTYLPTPEDLVKWMSDPAEIDRRVKGTEYWMLIDPKAPQQRTGVLGSLNMSADSFRLLPKEDETSSTWTATQWAESRRGWIFIMSRPTMREALRPLIMYGPPLCRKRKMRVTVWSAQMYSAFVGAEAPGQDGMRRAPFPFTLTVSKDSRRVRVWGAPGSTVVPSHDSPADLAGNRNLVPSSSRSWFADVGIAQRFPRLSLDSRHLQASPVSQHRWPIGISAGQYSPCHACQLVGQRHPDDVVVAAR